MPGNAKGVEDRRAATLGGELPNLDVELAELDVKVSNRGAELKKPGGRSANRVTGWSAQATATPSEARRSSREGL